MTRKAEITGWAVVVIITALFSMFWLFMYPISSETTETNKGMILDFDVQPGGFFTRTTCKVTTNQTTIIAAGAACYDLEINKTLYHIESLMSDWWEVRP